MVRHGLYQSAHVRLSRGHFYDANVEAYLRPIL